MSTGDDILPGNNGLKDQALALKWIKENIESFGGNSNSITITGFSSGAASVHYHYFSPLSKNLFNRGMSFSGCALNSFALQFNPIKRAKALADALLCDTSDERTMVNCIKSRPSRLIINATAEMNNYKRTVQMPFVPVVEKKSRNAFISEHPFKMLKEGKVFDVPWIVSRTTHEGLLLSMGKFLIFITSTNNNNKLRYVLKLHSKIYNKYLRQLKKLRISKFISSNNISTTSGLFVPLSKIVISI